CLLCKLLSLERSSLGDELAPCSECDKKILTVSYEPFTILACGHTYHRYCIEKKISLTDSNICPIPGCDKSVEPMVSERRFSQQSSQSSTSSIVRRMSNLNTEVIQEDEEMDDADDDADGSVDTPIKNSPNLSSKKRVSDSTEKSSSKKGKKLVKDEDSRMLKRLIQELITDIPRISEVKEREALQRESIRGSENKIFFDLYLKISNAEKQNDNVRHELIRSYYYFGEELEKRLTQYKDLPEHKAQKKINNEFGQYQICSISG
ncbi:5783_t:CDS:2, partial [Entrophospora sp. SA101]